MLHRRIDKKLLIVFLVSMLSILAGMGIVQTVGSSASITITSPTNGGTVPAGSLTVAGIIRASGHIRAFINLSNQGRSAEVQLVSQGADSYAFHYTFQDCVEGSYIITVLVIDDSGRVLGSTTIKVTLQGQTAVVSPLPEGSTVPCGVQPCTPPGLTCGNNPCPPPVTPPPVTVNVPGAEAPPPQVVIVSQPPVAAPPVIVKVGPPKPAPPPIVVFDQQPPPPQDIHVILPPAPPAPPPVTIQAPNPPGFPPPVITIDRTPPPPPGDTSPCNCESTGIGGGGGNHGGGGQPPHDAFFDDP